MFKILLFCISFTVFSTPSTVKAEDNERGKAEGRVYRYHYDDQLHSFYRNSSWKIIPIENVQKGMEIPSQRYGPPSLVEWSCGPNSAARSLLLMGLDFCAGKKCRDANSDQFEKEYEAFAHGFPKSLGYPGTQSGHGSSIASVFMGALVGIQSQGSFVSKAAISGALILAGLGPYILWLAGAEAGALPHWLEDHLKEIGPQLGFKINRISGHDFKNILVEIKQAIDEKNPLITFVTFDALIWHYFVIFAYNDALSEVLILDTSKRILKASYADLETLMNFGLLQDDYNPTYVTTRSVAGVFRLAKFNLIRFKKAF